VQTAVGRCVEFCADGAEVRWARRSDDAARPPHPQKGKSVYSHPN
jgi:hypothetical protein